MFISSTSLFELSLLSHKKKKGPYVNLRNVGSSSLKLRVNEGIGDDDSSPAAKSDADVCSGLFVFPSADITYIPLFSNSDFTASESSPKFSVTPLLFFAHSICLSSIDLNSLKGMGLRFECSMSHSDAPLPPVSSPYPRVPEIVSLKL